MEQRYAAQPRDRDEGKIDRGWRLTQVAWKLIRSDRTMLVLALAGIGSATAAVFLVLGIGGYFSAGHRSGGQLGLIAIVALYPSTLRARSASPGSSASACRSSACSSC